MAEDKLKALQESAETPATSSVEEKTPEKDLSLEGVKEEVSSPEPQEKEKTPEEVEWESLKGSTQERILQLIHERDEYKNKIVKQAEEDVSKVSRYSSHEAPPVPTNEIEQAVSTLKEHGVATKDDLYALLSQIENQRDHERLESKYDGSEGLPKYNKDEVEDYKKRKNIWNNEAAFRDMYFDEWVDAKKVSKRSRIYSEKPTASASEREEPLTTETFREKLAGEKGREFYEKLAKNPELMDKIVRQLSQG